MRETDVMVAENWCCVQTKKHVLQLENRIKVSLWNSMKAKIKDIQIKDDLSEKKKFIFSTNYLQLLLESQRN